MGPLHTAELIVRASLQKEALSNLDKAVLKGTGTLAGVTGVGVVANEMMGNPLRRQLERHKMRMIQQRATYDPKTRRMI